MGRGGARWAFAMAALAAVAAWFVSGRLASIDAGPPLGPVEAAAPDETAPSVAVAHAAARAGAAGPAREAAAVAARVTGTVRLDAGDALPAVPVHLLCLDTPRSPQLLAIDHAPTLQRPLVTATDRDGAFGFHELAAGRYRLSVGGALAPAQEEEFVLATATQHVVDFVLRGTLVRGVVQAGPAVVPNARYSVRGDGQAERTGRTDGEGQFWIVLPPGRYEVKVYSDIWPVAPLGEHTVDVPRGVTRTEWRLAAAGTDLEVAVRDRHGMSPRAFTVRLDGTLTVNGERAVREFPGVAGRAVFERIPAGAWTVSVRSPEFVAPPPRELATCAAVPRERVDFVVAPGVVVPLVLRRPDGATLHVDPECLPWLTADGVSVPCTLLAAGERGDQPHRIGFVGVPPGRVELTLADRSDAIGIDYLPFDPVAAVSGVADADGGPPLHVDVLPRAAVDLRGCEASGREDPAAHVRVFAGEREVRGRPRQPQQRWLGWLPPGDYRVVVERSAGAREHALRVDRADVQQRLRP